jgi:putative membrane protein
VPAPDQPPDSRHFLAAERTLLAYVRTALAMIGLGFVIARFGLLVRELAAARGAVASPQPRVSVWIGTGLVLSAAAVIVLAAIQYRREVRRLNAAMGEPWRASRLATAVAVLMCAAAIATAAYLLSTT